MNNHTRQREALANAEPGQTILLHHTNAGWEAHRTTETTIARVTKTQIILDTENRADTHQRFSRRDGEEIGGTHYGRAKITFPTDQELADTRRDDARRHLAHHTEATTAALRTYNSEHALTTAAQDLTALGAWAELMERDIANGQRPRPRPSTTIDKVRP